MTMVDERAAEATDQEEKNLPVPAGEVTLAKPEGGFLTLKPRQRDLDPDQRATLSAIVPGIDLDDETAQAQIRLFIQVCQERGLSPWTQEIYLVKRGEGRYATYTIQTGINGYRKLAHSTGRIRKGAKWLWTGADDDPASWREARDPDTGDLVMERVWWSEWPEERGNPGAARAIIYHYDEYGEPTYTDFVAHWKMYAPYYPDVEWVYDSDQGKRVKRPKTGPDGKPLMKLNDMWTNGGAHMAAKCAEAGAYRKAFPGRTAGIYVTEEMHQADAAEARRRIEKATSERRKRYLEATAAPADPRPAGNGAPVPDEAIQDADIVDDSPADDQGPQPTPVAEVMPEIERKLYLLAEIRELAKIRGVTPRAAVEPLEERVGKPLGEATSEEILHTLGPLRDTFVGYLRANGEEAAASAYAEAGRELIAPVEVLFGRPPLPDPKEWAVTEEDEPGDGRQDDEGDEERAAGLDVHPFEHGNKPNAFLCKRKDCGGYEDDPVHGGPA